MTDVWTRLKNETKPILLYGTGNGADKILDKLNALEISVSGVFASDGFVRNRTFRGFEVISFKKAEEIFKSFLVLMAFGSNRNEVFENVLKISKTQEIIMADVPVYDTGAFDLSYAKEHKAELEAVYNILADEQSKKAFKETLLFKLDGDISRLFACETNEDEAFSLFKLPQNPTYLDLGGYNGDTALSFAKRFPEYESIVAVEPDKKNFSKLIRNTENLKITPINAAISDKCGRALFKSGFGRGSNLGAGDEISVITVDSLEKQFDFIKFDVEGQELKAIEGAKKTIKEQKPKMLISCYHKNDDYFSIPLKVLSINPDYKVYMRHYPYIPAWDTNFYFV